MARRPKIDPDFAPPYVVDAYKKSDGELVVQVSSRRHVVAIVMLPDKQALKVAKFIVDACNETDAH